MRWRDVVPANLRGLHAWLANLGDDTLAENVIRADPLGVITYGDADALDEPRARLLLKALEEFAERDPLFRFGWRARARSLTRGSLLHESWQILKTGPRGTPGADELRLLIAWQMDEQHIVAEYSNVMLAMLLDDRELDAVRSAMGRALATYGERNDWPEILDALRQQGGDSCRLAAELLDDIGFEPLSNRQIAELVLTLTHQFGGYYSLPQNFPDERLDGQLDALAEGLENTELTGDSRLGVVGDLLARRLERPLVEPVALWRWLEQLVRYGALSSRAEDVACWLAANPSARHAIQKHVLLERPGIDDLRQHDSWWLKKVPGLAPTDEDVVALLNGLAADDARWRDVLAIARRDNEIALAPRAAARRFAGGDAEVLAWIDAQAELPPPEWQVRDELFAEERRRQRDEKFATHRAWYAKNRGVMRVGDGEVLREPAKAYLGLNPELPREAPPHKRAAAWLGDELGADALVGFEAFLSRTPAPAPDAEQIAQELAVNRIPDVGWVLVAALAERLRLRLDGPFADVADERLIAGRLIAGWLSGVVANETGLIALEAELVERGAFERCARLLVEPHLRQRTYNRMWLSRLMHCHAHRPLAVRLAAEWLTTYTDLPADTEEVLIDALVRTGDTKTLARLAPARLDRTLDERRRRDWQAAWLWADFDAAAPALDGVDDATLLSVVRDRLGAHHASGCAARVPVALAAWIMRRFRATYPWASRRQVQAVFVHDRPNPPDASDFLADLVARLAEDPSGDAQAALAELAEAAADSWTPRLRSSAADQARKLAEATYCPRLIDDIRCAVTDEPPASIDTLRDAVLEALDDVQAQVRGDSTDCWRGFYKDNKSKPKNEEGCSDHLVVLLRATDHRICFQPEDHMPANRETDIACSIGALRLPIEAKGQWHRKLWTAYKTQLAGQQAVDHRAGGRGIYLVYWFGANGKRLKSPPRGVPLPGSAKELEEVLAKKLIADGLLHLRVKVLDLSPRPLAAESRPIP
ncbi:MAG: hypothetical protein IPK80_02040 [Nannocystis sp.]|nr:hypothetical protein [Nannocystis sp.]